MVDHVVHASGCGNRSDEWSLFSFSVQTRVVSVWKPARGCRTSAACAGRCPAECRRPGAGMSGLASVGRQPCSSPVLPAWSIRCSTSRTETRYSSSLRWSAVLTCAAQAGGVVEHGVEHALVGPADFVAEQPVEGQGRIQLQRRRRGRRAPRDVRAVDHRVVLVDRRDRRLAAQHQARHLGLAAFSCSAMT